MENNEENNTLSVAQPICKITCSVCRSEYIEEGDNLSITFTIHEPKEDDYPSTVKAREIFGSGTFDICLTCLMKALGIGVKTLVEKQFSIFSFDKIFQENTDESLTTKVPLSIRGKTIAPGITFKKNETVMGENFDEFFSEFKHNRIYGKIINGIVVIG